MLTGAGRPAAAQQQAAAYNLESQYRHIVMAAEDNRLRMPDWLRTPLLDQHRLRMNEDVRLLLKLAHDEKRPEAQRLAIRALGRYESREFITDLLPLVATVPEARDAIVRSFRGPVHPADQNGEQMQRFVDIVATLATKDQQFIARAAEVLGDLPYDHPAVAQSALGHLRQFLRYAEANPDAGIGSVASALYNYVRKSNRLSPITEEFVERLKQIAINRGEKYQTAGTLATAALVRAGAMDIETLRIAATDPRTPIRRYDSAIALAGAAMAVDDVERAALLRKLMADPDLSVRIEAIRGWARQSSRIEGCDPMLQLLAADRSMHIVLVVLDLLGEACRDSEQVTEILAAEGGKAPPTNGEWHRAVHAFVSLSKRAPDRVTIPLRTAYAAHPTWQVRMYAARIATALKDLVVLERLAVDAEDNVREAALGGLRALKGSESDPIFIAALKRSDYQLVRRAALELKGATQTPELAVALVGGLMRISADRKDTSRDTRLALIERIAELGYPDQAEQLGPLLRDFDIEVAVAAANLLQQWTGRAQELDPRLIPRPPLPSNIELLEDVDAVIQLASGKRFGISFRISTAPMTVTRFKRLVRENYYDGLTFHRVVPNFVVQGGSPGANEYAGADPYIRDEIGAPNQAYAVGLSTRGRDTGDGQFFINLIDNDRLNDDYTVFGRVCEILQPGSPTLPGPGKEAVDSILEGDRIHSIALQKWDGCR